MNLYNENEPYCAQWIRNLCAKNCIADGFVDTRSVVDLAPKDLKDVTQFHAFAGIGGWSYALRLAGVPDDAEVWTGSCPCTPFSLAGKRRGMKDERHLWPAWFRLIKECHPSLILGEQVSSSAGLAWFDLVSNDLENEGYAVAATDISAAGVGAPHIRQRLYWVAYDKKRVGNSISQRLARRSSKSSNDASQLKTAQRAGGTVRGFWDDAEWIRCTDGKNRPAQPGICPLAARLPGHVGKIRAYGNAVNSQTAATFVRAVMEVILDGT